LIKVIDMEVSDMMDTMIQNAAKSRGQTYLNIERELTRDNPVTVHGLQRYRNHPDPVIRLMVGCLLSWISGNAPEFQSALDYLEEAPKRVARTPARFPSPGSVAYVLNERFGSRAADFLALRLAKELNWPRWRVLGILRYLKEQKLASTTSALLRFSMETDSEEARGYAIGAIQAIADPELEAKVQIERQRVEEKHQALVTVLENLTSQNGPMDEGARSSA
jgi:hypothetical protein